MRRFGSLLMICPLLIVLLVVIGIELQTGKIPDAIVAPLALYLLIAGAFVGEKPWWHYVLSSISIFVVFLTLAALILTLLKIEGLGGGAVKLLGAVGAALGGWQPVQFGICFIGLIALYFLGALLIFHIQEVPSSPVVLISVLIVLVWNRAFHFRHRAGSQCAGRALSETRRWSG